MFDMSRFLRMGSRLIYRPVGRSDCDPITSNLVVLATKLETEYSITIHIHNHEGFLVQIGRVPMSAMPISHWPAA
jgi:hypothetical protein